MIHDNDVERLRQLLAEYPALLSWRADGKAAACSEWRRAPTLATWAEPTARAGFHARGVRRAAHRRRRGRGAVGLREHPSIARQRVAGAVSAQGPASAHAEVLCGARRHRRRSQRASTRRHDLAAVNEAFVRACLFDHEAVASLLLERCHRARSRARETRRRRRRTPGLHQVFRRNAPDARPRSPSTREQLGLWTTFVIEQVSRAAQDRRPDGVRQRSCEREPWLLGDAWVDFQSRALREAS